MTDRTSLFEGIARGEHAEVEAINAFCFDPREFFVVLQAVDDHEETRASVLLRVPTKAPESYQVLDEFTVKTVGYWSGGPGTHYVQASGRVLRCLKDGAPSYHGFADYETSLMNITGAGRDGVVIYGDAGLVLVFDGTDLRVLETGTDEDLFCMQVQDNGQVVAAGDFGTYLTGDLNRLSLTELGIGDRIQCIRANDDGSVVMARGEGRSLRLYQEEITHFDEHEGDWRSIVSFQGRELWGDDQTGVFLRKDTSFVPVFETEYAFTMNATETLLTINAAGWIYIFNGSEMAAFEINAVPGNLIASFTPDFDLNWPS